MASIVKDDDLVTDMECDEEPANSTFSLDQNDHLEVPTTAEEQNLNGTFTFEASPVEPGVSLQLEGTFSMDSSPTQPSAKRVRKKTHVK